MDGLSVTEYIKKAFEYKASGNYKQAIEFLYKALARDNESSEVLNEIAGLYFKINNPERAIEYYEQALNIDPLNLTVKYNLAVVHKNIGNIQKALELLTSIYSKHNKLSYLLELLNILYLENRFQEAIDFYNKSDYQDFKSDSLCYIVGLCYMALGHNEEAERIFRQALLKFPNNPDIKFHLADLLYKKQAYKEAELILLNLLENTISAKAYFLLGEINFAKNELDKAINYLSLATNIESQNPAYFYELGMAYSLKGFLDEAEVYYQKAIKISPNDLTYNYTLAYLHYTRNEIIKANQKIAYILSINPEHTDTLVLRSLIAIKEGNINESISIIDEVLKQVTNNDFAYYAKALLYKQLNWWDKATETIIRAIELKPDSLEYLSELALYYYEAKYYGDSKDICKKIIDIDKKYIFAHVLLSKIFIKNKEFEKALKSLETAIGFDSNSHESFFLKAKVFEEQKEIDKAVDMARTATTIAPDKAEYYEFIAKCYYETKKYSDAFFFYKEASNIDILNVKYKYYLAKCSQYLGDVNNAIANFSIAKRLDPSDVFMSIDYADFLCGQKMYRKALDVLKSTLKNKLSSSDSEALADKIAEVERALIENSGSIQKWFIKIKK